MYVDDSLKKVLEQYYTKEIKMQQKTKINKELVQFQADIYSNILSFLMKRIDDEHGLYKNKNSSNSNTNKKNNKQINTKGNQIKKIICLIDEANIHTSKGFKSYIFKKEEQHKNFMIKVIQEAYLLDHNGHARKNMIFILSSIIPFSQERRYDSKGLELVDFADVIVNKELQRESFAELKVNEFINMAGDSNTNPDTNILRKIVNDVKNGEKSMRPYMSKKMSEEVKFDMENIWFQLLSQIKLEEIKDEKIKEKAILLALHKFLLYLAGQRFYLLKKWIRYLKHILFHNAKILKHIGILNKEIEATRNKKQKDIKITKIETIEAGLVYDKKINMGFLLNFLINKHNDQRLAIGSLDGASSEITNVSFWQRLDIFNIERSGVMFPYYVKEDTVDKICSATDTSELSSTETLLFELYYMGYIELNLSEEDEDGEEYMFTWVNYIKCNLLLLRLKDYKTKSVKFGCYNGDEVKNIKEMFELEYWRDILKKKITKFAEIAFKEEINRLQVENIEKQKILNSSKIKITDDMKNTEKEKEITKLKIERTHLYENTFKHQLKECLENFLRNELLGCLNEHDRTKSRLDDLIKVKTEESFLKVPDLISQNFNAKIDVVVYINLSGEVGDRLIVLFELKKEEPRLKDLKIFTDSNKHYDKIKFKEGSRVIYVAGSISEFRDKGKNLQPYVNGPKASFFADTEFKPYRDRVEEDEQEREND